MTKSDLKIMTIFGTRPEAIKLAPIIHELQRRGVPQIVCVTGQHRKLLDQMLEHFQITTDYDLGIMTRRQTLEQISSKVLLGMEKILEKEHATMVLVQGDTTTALMGALAAFYKQIPIGHVEAGLRTDQKYVPFPEEINRRMITVLGDLHFAPTRLSADNVERSGVDKGKVFITGNPVVDALYWTVKQNRPFKDPHIESLTKGKRIVLITTHRRENVGMGMKGIFWAVAKLANEFKDAEFVFPVHPNPVIRSLSRKMLKNINNIHLIEPLEYSDLAKLMNACYFVMSDSGGIQEEAPSLGKPVLVLRDVTERPEGIAAGTLKLVGTDIDKIYRTAKKLFIDKKFYNSMSKASNPYGDGKAAKKIVDIIVKQNGNLINRAE